MDFTTYLNQSTPQIEKEIERIFHDYISQQKNPVLKKLYTSFAKNVKGGKYIRGTLILLGYSLSGKGENKNIVPVAAAYEVLHTSLLIHDDIIDNSLLRRGKTSLWKQVGIFEAICLADAGFFLAQKILADSKLADSVKNKATSLLSTIILDTISGEMLDVRMSQSSSSKQSESRRQPISFPILGGEGQVFGSEVSSQAQIRGGEVMFSTTLEQKIKHSHSKERNEEGVLSVHTLKTAQYSIAGPLMIGALLSRTKQTNLNILKDFGTSLGIAFQIVDDILGVFGNEKTIGKSITSDIEENKNTLLITYALDHANPQQKQILQTLYGKKRISKKQLQHVQTIFKETGALAYSQEQAQEYIEKAKMLTAEITKDKRIQKLLEELAEFVGKREK